MVKGRTYALDEAGDFAVDTLIIENASFIL